MRLVSCAVHEARVSYQSIDIYVDVARGAFGQQLLTSDSRVYLRVCQTLCVCDVLVSAELCVHL